MLNIKIYHVVSEELPCFKNIVYKKKKLMMVYLITTFHGVVKHEGVNTRKFAMIKIINLPRSKQKSFAMVKVINLPCQKIFFSQNK